MTDQVLLVAVVIYCFSGVVKGTLGLGLPTTAVSLMAQVADPRYAIALVVIPMIVTNAWQVYRSGDTLVVLRQYWRLVLSMMCLIGIFSQLAINISGQLLMMILGISIGLFAAVNLWHQVPPLADRLDTLGQWVTGSVAGVLGGLSGLWAPPIVIYLGARQLEKDMFVRVLGTFLFLGSCVLFTGYWQVGIITREISFYSLLLIVPALLGFSIGERIRHRLSGERFRKWVLIFFLVVGLNLIRRSFYL